MQGRYICVAIILFINFADLSAQTTASDSMAGLAESEIIQGNYSLALEFYLNASNMVPENLSYHIRVGTLFGWMGRFDEGIRYLTEIYEKHPSDTEIMLILARLHSWNEQFDIAEKYYKDIIKQSDDNPEAYIGLGRIYSWSERFNDAISNYLRALQFDPLNSDAYLGLGNIYSWQGNYEWSIRYLDNLLQYDPDNQDALKLKAKVLGWNDETGAARALYHDLIKKYPDDPDVLLGLARIYAGESRSTTAYRYAVKARSIPAASEESEGFISQIHRDMEPRSETWYRYPWDSDNNISHIWGERVDFGITPSMAGTVIYTGFQSKNRNFNLSETSHNIVLAQAYTLNKRNSIRSNFGISLFPGNGSSRPGYGASFIHKWRNHTVSANFNRFYLAETPNLIAERIGLDDMNVSWNWITEKYSAHLVNGFSIYTDENQRNYLGGNSYRLFRLNQLDIKAGVKANYLSFLKNQFSIYFSPKYLITMVASGEVRFTDKSGRFYFGSALDIGSQMLRQYNMVAESPAFTYMIHLLAGYQITERIQIETGYLYSTSLVASSQARPENYWYQMIELKTKINLNYKLNPFIRISP